MATLAPGTRLGVYEVVDGIGAGGMGTVYRARDTRLPRDAAIKVSSERFSDRFAGEAHAIASLNHPNITTLYDVGPDYLVMELVEGPTLAERIAQGPLRLDEAATIGRQIADALDYAHERGIVHRDLKPGNVKIRPDGVVKVLDFGLAKARPAAGSNSDAAPTVSAHETAAGVIVGTFAYMSPEQLTGKAADRRADVWAFGCVFYEMLTGRMLHRGDSSQAVMASVLRDEPDLTKVPAQARRLLKRCLEKDPQKRLRHIGDVMALLDEPPSGESSVTAASAAAPAPRRATWLWPAVATLVVLGAATATVRWAPWRSQGNTGQAVRFDVPETDQLKFFAGAAMAVSPNGRWMVFPARGETGPARYWLRALDSVEARPLPGTEGAYVPAAWTADSRYVIFTVIGNPALQRVDIQGGPPQTISRFRGGGLNGAAASQDGTILFASSTPGPIFRVAASGDAPTAVTAVSTADIAHRFPQFLPDGRRFLYFVHTNDQARSGVYLGALDVAPEAQRPARILASDREAYYVSSSRGGGRLVFMRGTTLVTQPFDVDQLQLSGEAIPVADRVDSFQAVSYGMFSVSDSDDGALAFRGGAGAKLPPTLFDADGRVLESFDLPDAASPQVSPDGSRIAVAAGPPGARNIWTIDLARKAKAQLTFSSDNADHPVWSPDGKNIAFQSGRGAAARPSIKPSDGSGDERPLTDQPGVPTSWSRDGRFLLFTSESPKTRGDIWALPDPGQPSSESKPFPVLASPANEGEAQFSPDGRWIAYESNESSPSEVYVRPFQATAAAGGGAKWLVSVGGGLNRLPRWNNTGTQLVYVRLNTFDMLAVDVDTSSGFRAGTPRRLFAAPPPMTPVGWAPAPDGRRFLFITTPDGGRTAPFTVVLNWAAALAK